MTTPVPDPVPDWRAFPEFYTNPIISELAYEPRWTVSDPKTKMPYDVRAMNDSKVVHGARTHDDRCLMTLPELLVFLPNAVNNAFYLEAMLDNVVILDIEPRCDPTLVRRLLTLPSLYSELSMSGHGYHLVLPLPANADDFPLALQSVKVQHPDQSHEILINHYVTFTRRPIPDSHRDPNAVPAVWEDVFASLATYAKPRTFSVDVTTAERPEIRFSKAIEKHVLTYEHNIKPAKYNNDLSRWEFAVLHYYYRRIDRFLASHRQLKSLTYDIDQRAWLLYEIAVQVLPHRDKHDTLRSGLPFLLARSYQVVTTAMHDHDND